MQEVEEKLSRVRALIDAAGLDGVLINRVSNFAWLTGGAADYVNVAIDAGPAAILVTRDSQRILVNNIEAPRLIDEEHLVEFGFEFETGPWHGPHPMTRLSGRGMRLGADTPRPGMEDVGDAIKQLRLHLLPEEVARFRACAAACAAAMDASWPQVRPGQTEFEIAAILAHEAMARGAFPIVNLIATDERIFKYRHPLPTEKRLERYAMLVLSGRRRGVATSITRLVHFGRLPEEIRAKHAACAAVEATMIAATRPGVVVGDIFAAAQAAYAAAGFPGEWEYHHQGGPAGYDPREYTANASSDALVEEGQVYAWNPSIAGVKCEDTILIARAGNEVLTQIEGWPTLPVEVAGQSWQRPTIREL